MIKKIFSTLLAVAMVIGVASCGDDNDGPQISTTKRSIKVINHVVNTRTGEVLPITSNVVDYVFDRVNQKVTEITIRTTIDGEKQTTVTLSDLQSSTSNFVCTFKGSGSGIENLRGKFDFSEGILRLNYNLVGNYRVISTTPEIFSKSCATSCLYSDGKTSKSSGTMYQFNIDPEQSNAKLNIMELIDEEAKRELNTVKTLTSAKVTATKEGYVIEEEGQMPTTTAYKLNGKTTETTKYPVAGLKATLDLENNKFEATMQVGSISVTASGSVSN